MKSIVAIVLLFALASLAHAADQPGPIPGAPWLHEGLVITSTWSAAYVPGNDKEYHESPDGKWQDANGTKFKESEVSGTSGGGVAQMVVSRIDKDKIVGTTQAFGDARATGLPDPLPLQNTTGFVVPIGQESDYWIDPAHLAELRTDGAAGLLVEPVQWKLPDRVIDAIRVAKVSDDRYTDHVFDRKTGLCVHYASSTQTAPAAGPRPIGQPAQNNTTLTQGDFISFRDIKVPWATDDMPAWATQFKALHFRGQITFRGGALVQVPNQLILDITPKDHGDGWLQVNMQNSVVYQNLQPAPSHGQFAFGRCQFAGLWASPAALAKLHQGDVLDEDPITKMRTVVSSIDDRSAVISQTNRSGQIVSEYDKSNGMMIGSSFYSEASKQEWALRLQGKE